MLGQARPGKKNFPKHNLHLVKWEHKLNSIINYSVYFCEKNTVYRVLMIKHSYTFYTVAKVLWIFLSPFFFCFFMVLGSIHSYSWYCKILLHIILFNFFKPYHWSPHTSLLDILFPWRFELCSWSVPWVSVPQLLRQTPWVDFLLKLHHCIFSYM